MEGLRSDVIAKQRVEEEIVALSVQIRVRGDQLG